MKHEPPVVVPPGNRERQILGHRLPPPTFRQEYTAANQRIAARKAGRHRKGSRKPR